MGATFVKVSYIVVVSLLSNVVFTEAQIGPMPERSVGCSLDLNNGFDDMEPMENPLQITIRMHILRIRDVPDSGGSFSVDMK